MKIDSTHAVFFDLDAKNVCINFSGHKQDLSDFKNAMSLQSENARVNIELNSQTNLHDINAFQLASIMKYLK